MRKIACQIDWREPERDKEERVKELERRKRVGVKRGQRKILLDECLALKIGGGS